MSHLRFWCQIGLHDFEALETVRKVAPKRGPFDPRTEEERYYTAYTKVCVHCGKIETYEPPRLYA